MFPLINIFGKEVSTYAIMAILGIFAVLFVGKRTCKRLKIDDNDLLITGLWAAIGVVVGGHLVYGLTHFDWLIYVFQHLGDAKSFSDIWDALVTVFGGQVFYGGLIGGLIAAWIYLRATGKNVAKFMYAIAPLIPLFHAFGRIGCFLGGCCYGIEMEHGIVFHDSLAPGANDVPRLPIQLIEAVCNFALFGVLYYLQRKGKCQENLIFIYLLSYSIIRFVDEFFRGDGYRGFLGPFSTSQVIGLGLFTFSIGALVWTSRKKRAIMKKLDD